MSPSSMLQIIVKFKDTVDLPYEDDIGQLIDSRGFGRWSALEQQFSGVRIRRLYRELAPARIKGLLDRAALKDATYKRRNLLTLFVIECPTHVNPSQVADNVRSWQGVEFAYVDRPPSPATVPPPTGNCSLAFRSSAAKGVGATDVRTLPGAQGQGQNLVDLELDWNLQHESLTAYGIPPPVVGQTLQAFAGSTSEVGHGTSVLAIACGVDAGTQQPLGVSPSTGQVRVASYIPTDGSFPGMGSLAVAIATVATLMQAGDVLLIPLETPDGFPVDADPTCLLNIRAATGAGIVVVEAAGNHTADLDTAPALLDASGQSILRRPRSGTNNSFQDSLAIVVASSTSAVPHTLYASSNFGSRVDCYAWGENIFTADSSGPGDNASYVGASCFGETSGAAAIIAGVALSVQGMSQHFTGNRMDPAALRALLSNPANGTVGSGAGAAVMGVMPDLKKIAATFSAPPSPPPPSEPTNVRIIR